MILKWQYRLLLLILPKVFKNASTETSYSDKIFYLKTDDLHTKNAQKQISVEAKRQWKRLKTIRKSYFDKHKEKVILFFYLLLVCFLCIFALLLFFPFSALFCLFEKLLPSCSRTCALTAVLLLLVHFLQCSLLHIHA